MTGHPPRPGQGRDTKSNLLDAARAAIKDREAQAAAAMVAANTPARRKRRVGWMLTLSLVGGALLLMQPAWLVGPDTPPAESPGIATASLRLTMVRERGRILAFQKRHGRLPATLQDAGVEAPWIQYQRLSGSDFRIAAVLGDSSLVLTGADSTSVFLGSSLKVLQERAKP